MARVDYTNGISDAKQEVLRVYPRAWCEYVNNSLSGSWNWIRIPYAENAEISGKCPTPEEAWIDAASKLPVAAPSAKEKVLAVYPHKFSHQLLEEEVWAIFDSPKQTFGSIKKWFLSEQEAWEDAASRLPVPPAAPMVTGYTEYCPEHEAIMVDKAMETDADRRPAPSAVPEAGEESVSLDVDRLVNGFSAALRAKLIESERKYGWKGEWKHADWQNTLRNKIRNHVDKGDPRDVAAYCAFAWHHGWSLAAPKAETEEERLKKRLEAEAINIAALLEVIETLQADLRDMRILADGDAKELMRLRDQLASLDADAARCAAPSEKTDWSALYSGVKATDARMETERLACDKCGGLQEQCTCPAEYEDAAPPIPPAAPVDLRHGVNCVKEPTIANVFTKGSTVISRKTMKMTAGTLGVLLLIIPPAAMALDWNIFSVIESTISSDIGGALTALNGIQSAMRQDQQALLFPVSLINQSHNYITTITTSYRGWMSGVFTLPVNSAQLTSSQSLERVFLGGSTSSIGSMNGLYNTSFGVLPTATAAPQPHRHMMDMDDALAKDALAQSIAADQATTSLVQIANQIESESATTAPGTAAMLSATARAAELQSLASQHKLLASMLREEGANLAHHNGLRKQSVQQMQQMNTNMRGTIAQQQGEE